jgi:hypothetical protein
MDAVKIDDVLRLQDLGLERLDEDQAILRFAQGAEARIARWLDFAKGALLMLMVPDDPDSGWFSYTIAGERHFTRWGCLSQADSGDSGKTSSTAFAKSLA